MSDSDDSLFKHFKFMKIFFVAILSFGAFAVNAQTNIPNSMVEDKAKVETVVLPSPKKWTCVAEGLAEFRYDGSNWASIRLAAYSAGGNYRVTKDQTGDVAKGVTADRTPFVCTNQ